MGSVPWGLLEVIAAGCGPVVKLWNPSEPQQAISIYEGTAVYSLDFSHNNRVLAVAGEKGQAVLYGGKGAAVGTGCEPVGTIPRVPSETADSVTCLKFAPNDSYLLGGCRNGLLHIWSLKDDIDHHMEPLNGSVTSAAVNPALTVLAASSASGQVLLCRYPTGQKFRTLAQKGPRAGCLGFAALQPSLLCGAKGSGQLLVWDIDHAGLGATEFNVHRAIVTGCSFVPNDPHLLVSCGEDGLLACTDRRTGGSAWDTNLRQILASVSMKYDGSMVAVGTSAGKVLVHDTRRISTTLATQEFSDELPVTALRWQHQTPSKSHKSRPSMGGTAAASSAPRSSAAAPAGKPPGSVLSTAAGAAGAKGHVSAAAAPAAPPVAGVGSAAAGASAAPAQPRAPLVVPGWDSGVKSAASVDSSDAEFGMRVMSPVRLYGSPFDSDMNSAGVHGAAGAGSFGTAAAATGGVHTAELGNAVLQTPTDSSASGAGYRGPTMFTPCVGYMGNMNSAGVTPFGGSTPDATPVSRLASAAPPPPPAAAVERPHESTSVAASSAAAAGDVRGAAGSKQVLQADAAAVPGRALSSRPTGSSAAATGPTAAAGTAGRSSRPSTAGAGVTAGASLHAGAASAAAGSAVGTHRRNTSDSAAATKAPAAAATTTAAATVKHKGSNRSTRSSTGDDVSSGSAADGTVLVVAAPSGADGAAAAAGKVVTVGAVGGTAAAGPQHISSSSSHVGPAAAAGGAAGAPGSSAGASGAVAAAAAAGGVSGVTGVALREDVFKAYIDERFKEFEDKMIGIHNSMYNEFAQSQADLVVALNSLAARQDQLAEAVTALTAALESLSDNKQQLQHTGIAAIPWI